MNCRKFEKQMQDYVDQALQETEAAEMKGHVSSCPLCDNRLRQWLWISESIGLMPTVEPQPDLEAVLRRRLKAGEPAPSWFAPLWIPKLAFQAVSVGLLGVVLGSILFYLLLPAVPLQPQVTLPAQEMQGVLSAETGSSGTSFRGAEPSNPKEVPIGTPVASGLPESGMEPAGTSRFPDNFLLNRDGEYVEYLLKGTGREEILVRMPRVIHVHPPVDSDQQYFRYISH